MTADRRDAELAGALDRVRPGLQGAAYLLTGDPRNADDILDAVLAELLTRRTSPPDLRHHALRGLVGDQRPGPLPDAGRPTVELVDGPRDAGQPPVVTELARLPPPERAAVILRHYFRLDAAEIADLLGRTPSEASALADRGTSQLQSGQAERSTDDGLADSLVAAIPYDRRTSRGAARDLANARRLQSHRRRRGVGLGVAAGLVLLLLVTQLRPPSAPVEVTGPLPTNPIRTSAPPPEPPCDTSDTTCQVELTNAWQTAVAEVVSGYVDPGDAYFDVHRTADGSLNRPGFWVSEGGALAIDLIRRDGGSTQVTVQIATSRRDAVRCGTTTHRTCVSRRFMDGNRFTLTETVRVDEGIEVQHSPEGTQVITAIARNTARGTPLAIGTGELMNIVQDPRMRLPVR